MPGSLFPGAQVPGEYALTVAGNKTLSLAPATATFTGRSITLVYARLSAGSRGGIGHGIVGVSRPPRRRLRARVLTVDPAIATWRLQPVTLAVGRRLSVRPLRLAMAAGPVGFRFDVTEQWFVELELLSLI